jgi:GTP-binding protein
MDSNDQERERGITILAKNTAINYGDYRINIVDTPGHADFGGEVERVLSMVDSVLLLVDAVDGPMPQTRFVTSKAFARGPQAHRGGQQGRSPRRAPGLGCGSGLRSVRRPGRHGRAARLSRLSTPRPCRASPASTTRTWPTDMEPLFETIIEQVPAPDVDTRRPAAAADQRPGLQQLRRRYRRGAHHPGRAEAQYAGGGDRSRRRPAQRPRAAGYGLSGSRARGDGEAAAGDIVCVTGIDGLNISDTLCDPATPRRCRALSVDEPTVSMTFQVNDSPFAGKEGKYVTSRNIAERLERELIHNVALRVEPGDSPDKFKVSGRGELHLSVLIETMRREGFELGVSRPGGDPQGDRRRHAGALRRAGHRLRRAAPGRADGRTGQPARRAQEHEPGRQGLGAPRVHRAGARPDRLPFAVPDPDLRQRHR